MARCGWFCIALIDNLASHKGKAVRTANTVVINARCGLRIEADQRVIVVAGLPVHHYRAEDAVAEAYAMVFVVESSFAQRTDVARAFGRSVRTVRRFQKRYALGGMAALGREEGWRRGRRRISGKRLRTIETLKSKGMSNRAIAHQLGVRENAIRKLVGPSKSAESAQLALPAIPSAAEELAAARVPSATRNSEDGDRATRSAEESIGDGDPVAAPEAANDDEPVGGHQTNVITSRWTYATSRVAYRMFERWRQENFFKYMREEFLLDALVDYQIEPEDPTRSIPNPERRALDKEIRAARADLAKLEREFGAAAANNTEQRRPTMRGFKIAHSRLGKQLRKPARACAGSSTSAATFPSASRSAN
jgi:transposase